MLFLEDSHDRACPSRERSAKAEGSDLGESGAAVSPEDAGVLCLTARAKRSANDWRVKAMGNYPIFFGQLIKGLGEKQDARRGGCKKADRRGD